ncbi:hypothetical protein SUGI_1181270 [Cryptomeria japonica]|uniref:cysteine-rich receptor-like protein kinase 44 n=1 Tax=Cryptomeria japonica TaxID=3369 RepID=UPI002414B289|nr:cysteine-rich receptor-like protein kinase 44 [Cryptomeria japonica]GLJ55030.1 hypothetical protein SUGI_1181270 [Cryptomeria japonica]
MQITYTAKYAQFFCVVLSLYIARHAAIDFYICDTNNHTSPHFKSNMNIVLNTLVNNTLISNGFNTSASGQSPDRVYGLLQCWRDASVEECLTCSQEANSSVRRLCGNTLGGRTWLNKCFIRFENFSFFGILDTNSSIGYSTATVTDEPDVFRKAVRELFIKNRDEAVRSPIRYSSGLNTSTSYPIYSMVQCWSDLTSVEDCRKCLTSATRALLDVTFRGNDTFQGGGVGSGSCYARFETYPFINPAAPSPSPLQPLSPQPIQRPPSSLPPPKNSSDNKGLVLGIVSGLLVIFLLCLFSVRRKLRSAGLWIRALLRKENLDSEVDSAIGEEHEIIFNLENIKIATRNFHGDNKLGEGGFGSVYKGTMPDGLQIAVKKLSVQSTQGKEQFLNEVKLVAKIQHRNLVKLLGCCAEGKERLLVYEHMVNKSLDKILFHPQRSEELDWPKRLNIILGVARGLLYLHEDSHLRIIHRDIKASNILLDEKMEPKISDFGLARLIRQDESHVETRLAGTYGYMAPEYAMLGQLSCKADVYSFGVVILEIICGRKNTDNRLTPKFQSLLEWVWTSYKRGNITEVIDKEIIESFSSEQLLRCIHVGLLCTQVDALVRPSMTSVHAMLSNSSLNNLENLINPPFVIVAQNAIPSSISTSTTSLATPLVYPSINDATITDWGAR